MIKKFLGYSDQMVLRPIMRMNTSDTTLHYIHTDGSRILHTLLEKHYNDLLDNQSSEQGKDEVTYF